MYCVNEMAQGKEACIIQTSFKDLKLYFCLVTDCQASGVYAPPERLVLSTEKATYVYHKLFEKQPTNLGANCNSACVQYTVNLPPFSPVSGPVHLLLSSGSQI